MPGRRPTQTSFTRGLDVLIAIARNGQVTVPDLARELDLPQSTVYRYVRSLREYALVEDADGTYVPGWRLMDIAGQQALAAAMDGPLHPGQAGGHGVRDVRRDGKRCAVARNGDQILQR